MSHWDAWSDLLARTLSALGAAAGAVRDGAALALERVVGHLWPAGLDGLDGLGVVLAIIGLQAALIAALLAYACLLRIRRALQRRYRAKLYNIWHYLVPAFLCGDLEPEYLRHSLKRRDYDLFGDFLRPYLIDLAGSDAQRLSALLGELGFKEHLRRLLRGRSAARRAYAVHYLALVDDRAALPLLRAALDDRSETVVYQAAEGLMRLQDFDSIHDVLARIGRLARANRDRLTVYLLEFGVRVAPTLQQIVRAAEGSPPMLVMVLRVLAYHRFSPATWDVLYLYMNTDDREVRIACVRTLAAMGEPTLVGFFEEMLGHEDPVVRAVAAGALGELGDHSHTAMLAKLLGSDDFWVVRQAVAALMRLEMLPWVIGHPDYGREHFPRQAWALVREALADHVLQRKTGRAA